MLIARNRELSVFVLINYLIADLISKLNSMLLLLKEDTYVVAGDINSHVLKQILMSNTNVVLAKHVRVNKFE